MKSPWIHLLVLALFGTASAQSLDTLAETIKGRAIWDQQSSTLRFTKDCEFNFPESGKTSFIWHIPKEVKRIVIGRGVTVNGCFHSHSDVSIEGEDRKTSIVYGTEMQSFCQKNGFTAYKICTFQNFGGTMRIANLTSLNPRAFHVRGWGNIVHVKSCDFLDKRDGHGNHSDGFEGGDGSTVDDCYFESGDDIIKVYFDVTVTNTTINMVTNTVPIQMGWGNYSDGAVGNFKNLTIIGDSGRGAEGNAIISGRKGKFDVTVNIDGCHIQNPNGSLVNLHEDSMTLRGNITNADIRLKSYGGKHDAGKNLLQVCGSNLRKSAYQCGTPPAPPKNLTR